ncbi:MAG TPA: SGNH/GDSL hydrolase family protein [Candidatus Saccharimonadales bacterium]|nr:SGNH/GDSL hydrolase family protein [Candidatus Saccharimonadales bacterium]
MTNDRVYVALARCIWDSCGSERKLYALDFRGVDLDFPRGAVLKYNEPWLSYVALGDSYSSGEGVEPFIAPSDTNGCHRSRDAYAKLLDGSPASRLNVTSFVACSGATTQDVINGKNGEPSQLNALATNQARRVTISAGGNDIDFVGVATACVTGNCGDGESAEAIRKIREELPSKLDTLYAEIRARVTATNARILVVGYPLLIPEVVDQNLPNCFYLQDDKDAARSVILELDAAIQAAVSRAGSPFEYVDPNAPGSPFIGHELCKSGSYFHGLVWPFNQGYTFHPNAAGQQAYRQLIETRLAS